MTGFFSKWSKTTADNATADSTVNWAEGQPPSSVNDSGRAMMAAAASFRDDISGALVCGGTSTAYTLTTNQAFATLAEMNGQEISFVVTPTNGADATLNVNGLGAKALVFSAGNAMPAGSLIDGSIYTATYVHASNCWKVHSVIGNPYNIPLAGGMDYWGTTVPNSNFAFPVGQAVSRTTYAALFAIMGTTYGVGDGSTTFNLPDKTGRVSAMKETVADGLRNLNTTYFGDSTAMGTKAGSQSEALSLAQLPTGITSTGSTSNVIIVTGPTSGGLMSRSISGGGSSENYTPGAQNFNNTNAAQFSGSNNITANVTSNNTSGTAHKNVQPTIICNYIIRII